MIYHASGSVRGLQKTWYWGSAFSKLFIYPSEESCPYHLTQV